MLKIEKENELIEWEFNGVKILSALNSSWTLIKLVKYINQHKVTIDENILAKDDCLVINEYTMLSDLIFLTKSSQFLKNIIQTFDITKIINEQNMNEILKLLNDKSNDLFNFNDNPVDFLIKNFQLNKKIEINNNNFLKILNCYKTSNKKKTIIISNCQWFSFQYIEKYLSWFNFIIITNSLKFLSLNSSQIDETIVIENYQNNWYEVLDKNKLFLHIESKINTKFNENEFNHYLNKNTQFNGEIYEILRKIF